MSREGHTTELLHPSGYLRNTNISWTLKKMQWAILLCVNLIELYFKSSISFANNPNNLYTPVNRNWNIGYYLIICCSVRLRPLLYCISVSPTLLPASEAGGVSSLVYMYVDGSVFLHELIYWYIPYSSSCFLLFIVRLLLLFIFTSWYKVSTRQHNV